MVSLLRKLFLHLDMELFLIFFLVLDASSRYLFIYLYLQYEEMPSFLHIQVPKVLKTVDFSFLNISFYLSKCVLLFVCWFIF